MGPRLRKPLERDVAVVRLLLRSYLRDHGYTTIDATTSACIDYFGNAGLPPHLTVQGSDVDVHFGVPVTKTIERMTCHLRDQLHRAMPDLLAPVYRRFDALPPIHPRQDSEQDDPGALGDGGTSEERAIVEAIFPFGPGAIRPASTVSGRTSLQAGLRAGTVR